MTHIDPTELTEIQILTRNAWRSLVYSPLSAAVSLPIASSSETAVLTPRQT